MGNQIWHPAHTPLPFAILLGAFTPWGGAGTPEAWLVVGDEWERQVLGEAKCCRPSVVRRVPSPVPHANAGCLGDSRGCVCEHECCWAGGGCGKGKKASGWPSLLPILLRHEARLMLLCLEWIELQRAGEVKSRHTDTHPQASGHTLSAGGGEGAGAGSCGPPCRRLPGLPTRAHALLPGRA